MIFPKDGKRMEWKEMEIPKDFSMIDPKDFSSI